MTDIDEAARLALITREQVRLVNTQAEIAELEVRAFSVDRARQARPLIIDWSSGQAAVYSDNVIRFPLERRLNR
jgi:hypothetical protein